MKRLSLKTKLLIGFGLLLVILGATVTVGYEAIARIDKTNDEVQRKAGEVELSAMLMESVFKEAAGTRGYLLTGREKALALDKDGQDEFRETVEKLVPLVHSATGKGLFAGIQNAHVAYRAELDKEADARRSQVGTSPEELLEHEESALASVDKATDAMVEHLKKDQEQLNAGQDAVVASAKLTLVTLGLIGILLGIAIAWLVTRSIVSSTGKMLTFIQELAANNLLVEDIEIHTADEIGRASIALNHMKNSLHEIIRAIFGTAQRVAGASEELSATSHQITANSEETSAQASVVSQAAEQVNSNLQSVSTGAEEMSSTIQSIATNANQAASVASRAVETAHAANTTVGKLGSSSAEIGEVIKVITSIAQQTNLLALNATIEAARAGEAGKGFAVVANEVKELAKQTAKATEDISQKVTAIQNDSKGAVEAIGTIGEVIDQVSGISTTIATAVEQQTATTNEMSRNVTDAAKGSEEITRNIAGVAEAAHGTSTAAQQSQKAADDLATMATQLHGLVSKFKIEKDVENHSGQVPFSPSLNALGAAAGN